jgi:PAS domain S-box-containing protein
MSTGSNYEKPRIEKLDQNEIQQKFADFARMHPEQTYRLIVENTYEGIVVAQNDKLRFINKRTEEITGYSREELISKNFIELVHPDDHEMLMDAYEKTLKDQDAPDTVSFRFRTKDGEIKWALGSSVKIDWQGKPALMGFVIDTTQQKQAENDLQQSKETLRALLNSTHDLALLVDTEGTVLTANTNAAERYGKKPEELIGTNIYPLMPAEMVELRKRKARELIETKQPMRYTEENAGKFFDCNLFPILDDAGEIKCFTVFVKDITERHQNEEALRKSREELEYRVKERTKELEIKAKNLEEVNTALKVLLKRLDEDKKVVKEKVLFNVSQLVEPYLVKLKKSNLTPRQKKLLDMIESNIRQIVSPFARGLYNQFLKLTPTEIQVANLIRQGKTTKEIADLLSLSVKTIEFHRDNIRRKIGIKNRKINLRTHLLSIQ